MENEVSSALSFEDFIGQDQIKADVKSRIEFANLQLGRLEHILLCSNSDMGKHSLVNVIAKSLGVSARFVNGNEINTEPNIANILSSLDPRDILVIEDFKVLKKNIKECLYKAMTSFSIDITIDIGGANKLIQLNFNPFTLVIITIKPWEIEEKFRRWFIVYDFVSYSSENIKKIIVVRLKVCKKYLRANMDKDCGSKISCIKTGGSWGSL